MPLKVAAKIDKADAAYYQDIKHLFDHPLIEYIGEINEGQKNQFLGEAAALLFPIDWPEPFGLVMVEAMACGTPVIAYPHGSVPEVMEHGVSGFIVDGLDQAVAAVELAVGLSRRGCRDYFERRFSVERMASDYVRVYRDRLGVEAAGVEAEAAGAEAADANLAGVAVLAESAAGVS